MMRKCAAFIASVIALACQGNALDLGEDSKEVWSDASDATLASAPPDVIFQGRSRMVAFAVDEEKLYALLEPVEGDRLRLDVCPTSRCASERKTLFEIQKPHEVGALGTPLLLAGGYLYWLGDNGVPKDYVRACSTDGCEGGPEILDKDGRFRDLTTDDASAYWITSHGSVRRRAHGQGQAVETLFELDPALANSLRITQFGEYLYLFDETTIYRAAKKADAVVEVIARDHNIDRVVVTRDALFYSRSMLTGAVVRCPLSGCAAGAEDVMTEQKWPSTMLASGQSLFWANKGLIEGRDGKANLELKSCELPDCSRDRTWIAEMTDKFQFEVEFAANSQFLFWRGMQTGDVGSALRRIKR